MRSIAEKDSGGKADDSRVIALIDRIDIETDGNSWETQVRLRHLAQKVKSEISEMSPFHSKELLGVFVSELFLSVVEEERSVEHRQKQAEGIAEAKARGVKFGRRPIDRPPGYETILALWRNGDLSARQAAKQLGITHRTFLKWAKVNGSEC